jgi:hypothetical protein
VIKKEDPSVGSQRAEMDKKVEDENQVGRVYLGDLRIDGRTYAYHNKT